MTAPGIAGDPVKDLADLLRDTKAVPRLSPERMVRSSFYDPVYRACVVGLAIRDCGKHGASAWALNDQLLRLFQFVSVHRSVLRPLQEWAAARRAGMLVPLQEWTGFPGGYATDDIYDDVLTYLTATDQVHRDGTQVVLTEAPANTYLWSLLREVDTADLFSAERTALIALKRSKVTLTMLQS